MFLKILSEKCCVTLSKTNSKSPWKIWETETRLSLWVSGSMIQGLYLSFRRRLPRNNPSHTETEKATWQFAVFFRSESWMMEMWGSLTEQKKQLYRYRDDYNKLWNFRIPVKLNHSGLNGSRQPRVLLTLLTWFQYHMASVSEVIVGACFWHISCDVPGLFSSIHGHPKQFATLYWLYHAEYGRTEKSENHMWMTNGTYPIHSQSLINIYIYMVYYTLYI